MPFYIYPFKIFFEIFVSDALDKHEGKEKYYQSVI